MHRARVPVAVRSGCQPGLRGGALAAAQVRRGARTRVQQLLLASAAGAAAAAHGRTVQPPLACRLPAAHRPVPRPRLQLPRRLAGLQTGGRASLGCWRRQATQNGGCQLAPQPFGAEGQAGGREGGTCAGGACVHAPGRMLHSCGAELALRALCTTAIESSASLLLFPLLLPRASTSATTSGASWLSCAGARARTCLGASGTWCARCVLSHRAAVFRCTPTAAAEQSADHLPQPHQCACLPSCPCPCPCPCPLPCPEQR